MGGLYARPEPLPALVRGDRVRQGALIVSVTDEMVRQRERQNEELSRQRQIADKFSEPKVRRRFIRRVFGVVTLQLMFTAGLIAAFLLFPEVPIFFSRYPHLTIVTFFTFLVTYIAILWSRCARRFPCNVIMLTLLTLSLAYMMAWISLKYSTEAVIMAASMTTLVTLTLTCIATCSKFDFTNSAGFFFVLGLLVLSHLVVVIVMWIGNLWFLSPWELALGIIGSLVFSMYLLLDLQMIMGGKSAEVSPDEVTFAAANLFVDIMFLYRNILKLTGYYYDN